VVCDLRSLTQSNQGVFSVIVVFYFSLQLPYNNSAY
jgi:hypothetical protein